MLKGTMGDSSTFWWLLNDEYLKHLSFQKPGPGLLKDHNGGDMKHHDKYIYYMMGGG